MEMLNYSLWFTFGWWALMIAIIVDGRGFETKHYIRIMLLIVSVPSIAILLEYLIVR